MDGLTHTKQLLNLLCIVYFQGIQADNKEISKLHLTAECAIFYKHANVNIVIRSWQH